MIFTEQWIAIAGLTVGAIGLVVSAIALVVAVWQIRKTQTAAESAAQAAKEAREAVQRVTSVSDLSQTSERIERLKDIIRNEQWQRALDHYTLLRQLLIGVEVRLSEEKRVVVKNNLSHAVEQLIIMEDEINKAVADQTAMDSARLQSILLEIQNDVDKAQAQLVKDLTGAS